ncbi:MAG: hypothetical protein BRC32_05495, partial [Actinobacteria bacterium QS_8_72_14]
AGRTTDDSDGERKGTDAGDHDAASRGSDHDAEAVAEHVVGALQATLPAATAIVAHHFRRRLLAAARARLEGA